MRKLFIVLLTILFAGIGGSLFSQASTITPKNQLTPSLVGSQCFSTDLKSKTNPKFINQLPASGWEFCGEGVWYDFIRWTDSDGNSAPDPDGWKTDFYQHKDYPNVFMALPFNSEDAINYFESIGRPLSNASPVYIYFKSPTRVYIPEYSYNLSGHHYYYFSPCPETGYDGHENYGKYKDGKVVFSPGKNGMFGSVDDDDYIYYFNDNNLEIEIPIISSTVTDSDHGLFVGIRAFNDKLSSFSIRQLNKSNVQQFKNFTNSLKPGAGTLLYASTEKSLDDLKKLRLPFNTKLVSLLTFTDGLDEGSLAKDYYPEYMRDEEFVEHLKDRITNFSYPTCNFESYIVGLLGEDAKYDEELFEINLESLSTKSENKLEVADFSDVKERLSELVKNLTVIEENTNIEISIPQPGDKQKLRFTFDDVTKIENSKLYIEGTYDKKKGILESIVYCGLTSKTGEIIKERTSGNNVVFRFDDCRNPEGEILKIDAEIVKEWKYVDRTGNWRPNTEFNGKESIIEISDYSSVVLLLNLDCSTSLGDRFPELIQLINDLLDNLVDVESSGNSDVNSILQENNPMAPVEFYNLQGIRINNPSKGLYLRKQGNDVKRIIIN